MPHLFEPLVQRGVTFRNRIGISPMCQYWCRDGLANDWHMAHLGARAIGGAAMVMAEATGVEARGRITPGCLGLWNDDQAAALEPVARLIGACGAVPAIQLAHAGRKASATAPWEGDRTLTEAEGAWETIGPMAEAFEPPGGALHHVPRAMTDADIETVIAAFAASTRRAGAAGFRMVELHAAHGYLLHSFLSPLTNRREDRWGGCFEDRIRFPLAVVAAMREAWPDDRPLWVRLSTVDWAPGGWTVEDSVALAGRLRDAGVDLVDCSSGFAVPDESYPSGPGWQVPLARRVRAGAGIATAAVGEIAEAFQADQIIRSGDADMVLLATASLDDPNWPFHAARRLGRLDTQPLPPPCDYVLRPG